MRSFVILVAVTLAPDGRTAPRPQDFGPAAAEADRTVFIAAGLSADQTLAVATAFAASGHPGVLLLDGPAARAGNGRFLDAFHPARVATLGRRPDDAPAGSIHVPFDGPRPADLWRVLFPAAERVVVCPAAPRRLLLQAAALAGAAGAPLFALHDTPAEPAELRSWLDRWQTREVLWVGPPPETSPADGLTCR